MLFSVEEGLDLMDQQQVDQIIEELLEFADGARGHVASPLTSGTGSAEV
jgi:hypothetical protein